MPGTGVGGGAGPRHGMGNPPESQPTKGAPSAEPAANRPVFRKTRLLTTPLSTFGFLATGFSTRRKGNDHAFSFWDNVPLRLDLSDQG